MEMGFCCCGGDPCLDTICGGIASLDDMTVTLSGLGGVGGSCDQCCVNLNGTYILTNESTGDLCVWGYSDSDLLCASCGSGTFINASLAVIDATTVLLKVAIRGGDPGFQYQIEFRKNLSRPVGCNNLNEAVPFHAETQTEYDCDSSSASCSVIT